MKTLIPILLMLVSLPQGRAQENTAKKEFLFENPVTKELIKIQAGNKVVLRFKIPDRETSGTILSFGDSSLILSFPMQPHRQVVPFSNIAAMKVIIKANKRYIIRVALKNGKTLRGELSQTTQDSLSIQKHAWNYQFAYVAASEIKSIRIRGRGALGNAINIGVGVGLIVGAIIGYDSHPIPSNGCHEPVCLDTFGVTIAGATIGGAVGAAAGALIGLASGMKFKIEGNQAQFDLFADEFKNTDAFKKSK